MRDVAARDHTPVRACSAKLGALLSRGVFAACARGSTTRPTAARRCSACAATASSRTAAPTATRCATRSASRRRWPRADLVGVDRRRASRHERRATGTPSAAARREVAIVTDSTADLDPADARARGIAVVPLFVQLRRRALPRSRRPLARRVLPQAGQPEGAADDGAADAGDVRGRVPAARRGGPRRSSASRSCRGFRARSTPRTTAAQGVPAARNPPRRQRDRRGRPGAAGAARRASSPRGGADASSGRRRAGARPRGAARLSRRCPTSRTPCAPGASRARKRSSASLLKIVPVLRIDARRGRRRRARANVRARASTRWSTTRREANRPTARADASSTRTPPSWRRVIVGRCARRSRTTPHVVRSLEAGPVIGTHAGQGAVGVFVIPGRERVAPRGGRLRPPAVLSVHLSVLRLREVGVARRARARATSPRCARRSRARRRCARARCSSAAARRPRTRPRRSRR